MVCCGVGSGDWSGSNFHRYFFGGIKWSRNGSVMPIELGQLNKYLVFETKSGAMQNFQKGKKCPI